MSIRCHKTLVAPASMKMISTISAAPLPHTSRLPSTGMKPPVEIADMARQRSLQWSGATKHQHRKANEGEHRIRDEDAADRLTRVAASRCAEAPDHGQPLRRESTEAGWREDRRQGDQRRPPTQPLQLGPPQQRGRRGERGRQTDAPVVVRPDTASNSAAPESRPCRAVDQRHGANQRRQGTDDGSENELAVRLIAVPAPERQEAGPGEEPAAGGALTRDSGAVVATRPADAAGGSIAAPVRPDQGEAG